MSAFIYMLFIKQGTQVTWCHKYVRVISLRVRVTPVIVLLFCEKETERNNFVQKEKLK